MKVNFYDQIAKSYDDDFLGLYRTTHKIIIQQIQTIQHTNSILDLCVGTGNFIIELARNIYFNQFIGVDISKKMLEVAKAKIPFQWTAIQKNALHIENTILPESQDLILSHFLDDFIPSEESLPMCYRLLKPGGFLSTVTTTKEQYDEFFYQQINKNKIIKIVDIPKQIEKASIANSQQDHIKSVEKHGFSVVNTQTLNLPVKLKSAKDLIDLGYHSGWLANYLSKFSPLQIHLLKMFLYLLQAPGINVYPLNFKFHCSLLLVQKK